MSPKPTSGPGDVSALSDARSWKSVEQRVLGRAFDKALTSPIPNCEHARELANHEDDTYFNLNGGRGTSGQVDVPPPPTEPEMTTF
jgi:hypothetical protein